MKSLSIFYSAVSRACLQGSIHRRTGNYYYYYYHYVYKTHHDRHVI